MKKEFLEKTTQYLRFQRNILAALSFLLSVSIVLLCTFLFLKRERVIITPPVVEKEFWVDADKVSPTYLEQYGCFLGQLLLSKSAQSALMQRTVLLRHADPSFAETLKQKLFEEEQVLQKQSASYTFFPVTIQAYEDLYIYQVQNTRMWKKRLLERDLSCSDTLWVYLQKSCLEPKETVLAIVAVRP